MLAFCGFLRPFFVVVVVSFIWLFRFFYSGLNEKLYSFFGAVFFIEFHVIDAKPMLYAFSLSHKVHLLAKFSNTIITINAAAAVTASLPHKTDSMRAQNKR